MSHASLAVLIAAFCFLPVIVAYLLFPEGMYSDYYGIRIVPFILLAPLFLVFLKIGDATLFMLPGFLLMIVSIMEMAASVPLLLELLNLALYLAHYFMSDKKCNRGVCAIVGWIIPGALYFIANGMGGAFASGRGIVLTCAESGLFLLGGLVDCCLLGSDVSDSFPYDLQNIYQRTAGMILFFAAIGAAADEIYLEQLLKRFGTPLDPAVNRFIFWTSIICEIITAAAVFVRRKNAVMIAGTAFIGLRYI